MGCCLVAALLLSLGRRAWSTLTGREPASPFPPAARRSAPGAAPTTDASDVGPDPRPARPVLAAPMAAAFAVLLYVTTVAALDRLGLVGPTSSPAVGALARDLLWAAVLVILALVALRSAPRTDAGARGRALTAAGVTWTVLLLLDVHALGRVEVAGAALDVALHLLGLVVLYAGLLLWRPLARRPTPARPDPLPDARPVGARS